jgi:hypothetical protein
LPEWDRRDFYRMIEVGSQFVAKLPRWCCRRAVGK